MQKAVFYNQEVKLIELAMGQRFFEVTLHVRAQQMYL
jgi:hypothetical protein